MNDESPGRAGTGPDFEAQLASVRGEGEAAAGLVRVTVDGTSNLVGLVIEPKAMRLASQDLTEAVLAAFGAARSAVRDQLSTLTPTYTVVPSEVQSAVEQLRFEAERRLDSFTQTVDDLTTRLDRRY
ncbi:YbaB/EbfC family nucleoid-associated protein [Actinopolymorpha pittospori]